MSSSKMARRYIITINNPFWNSSLIFEEIDINNTSLPLKLDFLKLDFLKEDFNKNYFDFKYIKWKVDEVDCVIERAFFKDIESVEAYIKSLEHIKYSCFQLEKGESETEHIQGFLIFTVGKRFETFKKYFPTSHIEKVNGSNIQARDYCSKLDTRILGPFEIGEFSEQGGRTDITNFIECVKNNMSPEELFSLYPSLYVKELNKLDKLRNEFIFSKFKNTLRDVEVTYIYGPPRTGKSKYIMETYGLGNYYNVDSYGNSAFDRYSGEDVIVFDEYDSQMNITYLNKLLDRYPVSLRARFEDKWACYSKVYIVSNLSLSEQYKDLQVEKPAQYEAFVSRIHNIIKFEKDGTYKFIKKKADYSSKQEEFNFVYDQEELKKVDELFGNKKD